MRKNKVGSSLLSFALGYCIFCAAAHTKHETNPVNKAKKRKSQIQRRQAISTQIKRNEKSIGQGVAGIRKLSQDIQKYVFYKRTGQFCRFISFPPSK